MSCDAGGVPLLWRGEAILGKTFCANVVCERQVRALLSIYTGVFSLTGRRFVAGAIVAGLAVAGFAPLAHAQPDNHQSGEYSTNNRIGATADDELQGKAGVYVYGDSVSTYAPMIYISRLAPEDRVKGAEVTGISDVAVVPGKLDKEGLAVEVAPRAYKDWAENRMEQHGISEDVKVNLRALVDGLRSEDYAKAKREYKEAVQGIFDTDPKEFVDPKSQEEYEQRIREAEEEWERTRDKGLLERLGLREVESPWAGKRYEPNPPAKPADETYLMVDGFIRNGGGDISALRAQVAKKVATGKYIPGEAVHAYVVEAAPLDKEPGETPEGK